MKAKGDTSAAIGTARQRGRAPAGSGGTLAVSTAYPSESAFYSLCRSALTSSHIRARW
jgi:hypothetical protein